MEKLKKIIIILVIIVFIIIVSICLINKKTKETMDEEGNIEEPEYIEGSYEADKTIKALDDKEEYFMIKEIVEHIQAYINYLDYDLSETRVRFNNIEEENQFLIRYKQEGIDSIKSMMSKEYIEEFNVSDTTIYHNLVKYANKDIKIKKIYVSEESVNIKTFFVYFNTTVAEEEFALVITLDSSENSFYMMLKDYMDKKGMKEENIIGEKTEQKIQSIEPNEYNTYDTPDVSETRYVQELFEDYRSYLSNIPNKAFDMLDGEYRQKRFSSNIENFKNYISDNSSYILDRELSKYKINKYNDYTEYVCMDQMGKYVIFREKDIMDYSVLLDNYTVDVKEFIEKYNQSNEQEKVGMNIQKVILALNNKDYNYIYNQLDNEFKTNKFATFKEFEAYMKQNLFDTNIVKYDKFSKEGKTYIYELTVKPSEEDQNSKNMTVIMQLLEDTDFLISFSIQ